MFQAASQRGPESAIAEDTVPLQLLLASGESPNSFPPVSTKAQLLLSSSILIVYGDLDSTSIQSFKIKLLIGAPSAAIHGVLFRFSLDAELRSSAYFSHPTLSLVCTVVGRRYCHLFQLCLTRFRGYFFNNKSDRLRAQQVVYWLTQDKGRHRTKGKGVAGSSALPTLES